MNKSGRIIAKSIFISYLIFIHTALIFLIYEKADKLVSLDTPLDTTAAREPSENQNHTIPPPLLPTFSENSPADNSGNSPDNSNSVYLPDKQTPENSLMIPVAGIKREQLIDTFANARSENRVHNAIDIAAPQGTPVFAAADGEIAKFFDSERGGITIYQYNRDKTLVYYYAHLQRRAELIGEKQFVKKGTVIGYVGDTGNAGAGNFHLHFSIAKISSPERYFDGENINPFPLLQNGIETE